MTFETDSFQLSLDTKGHVVSLLDKKTAIDYVSGSNPSPLLTLQSEGKMLIPQKAAYSSETGRISLEFGQGFTTTVRVTEKTAHLVFELTDCRLNDQVELMVWGPYHTTIQRIIGETVGVVQGESFALGLQALNVKTLGGYPWTDNDCMPQIDIFEGEDYSDLSEEGKRHVLYRVEAAKPTETGSSLQAYCRNRTTERITENWGHDHYTIPPFDDGGIIGSRIALFGCPTDDALDTLGEIEQAEGLPHPILDGEWAKKAHSATAAYMILGFGEESIHKALDITTRAGLRTLYHPDPFENWGHFDLKETFFPSGWDGLRSCVEEAEKQNIQIGVHTLSNFITTNDPYVTPVPDERLAAVGSSPLTETITATQTDIPVGSPDFFSNTTNNHLKTIRIGQELIRYGSISETEPWILLNCSRGAFGTKPASHMAGEKVSKLADHGYKVFLTNAELSMEVANRLAELFNTCGLRQISFDGLEGNRSTGMGNYGEILFTSTWYNALKPEIRSHFIADASRTSHYFWHIYTRMNWGEPWYAGFRESQTEYRLKNQAYFKRNLMPAMLGWFSMKPDTSVEDIEWMLARSAGFDAGYGFVTNFEVLEKNGLAENILQLLGKWEHARMADVFSDAQKTKLQDINREFHLEESDAGGRILTEIHSFKFFHEKKIRQPGEPLHSTFNIENPADEQPASFIITAQDSGLTDIRLEFDNRPPVVLPVRLEPGQHFKHSGGETAVLYDNNWNRLQEVPLNPEDFRLISGPHSVLFSCNFFDEGKEPRAGIEIRLKGEAENIIQTEERPPDGTERL